MNERIKELAIQTITNVHFWNAEKYSYAVGHDELKKFAELIVRECMNICYRTDTEYEGKKVKPTVIASKVAEHFGVEE